MKESDKLQKLPFYLVCDVSYSMATDEKITALNDAIVDVRATLRKEPMLADLAYFSLIDFSDDARVIVPLSDLSERLPIAPLAVRGGTSYAAAFKQLRTTIDHDMSELKKEFRVFRPTVFFLSDGEPQDSAAWPVAFAELTDYDRQTGRGFKFYPMVVPFGIGDADKHTLVDLVFPKDRSLLYMANDDVTAGAAIRKMMSAMLNSIVASAQTATGGAHPQITLPSPKELGSAVTVYSSDLDEL